MGLRVSPLGVVEIRNSVSFTTWASLSPLGQCHAPVSTAILTSPVHLSAFQAMFCVRHLVASALLAVVARGFVRDSLCRVYVKGAFRQVPAVVPDKASVCGYTVGYQAIIDLRRPFRWRFSPGFRSICSSAREHSHTNANFRNASEPVEGASAVQHIRTVSAGGRAEPSPPNCQLIVGTGDFAGSSFAVRYYVDGRVLVQKNVFLDGRRCSRADRSSASDHFRLLGSRRPNAQPLLSAANITNSETRLEVLGWTLDTQQLTVTMTTRKQRNLLCLLHQCPHSRTSATARQKPN